MTQPKFDVNSLKLPRSERALIREIVERAAAKDRTLDKLSLSMDLYAVHGHACPLALSVLLGFDDFNFMHDIYGIVECLNRSAGQLERFFDPRSAAHYHNGRRATA